MFDETLKFLRRLEQGTTLTISIEVDDHGYWDRRCPSEECGADFKVLLDDWKHKVREEVAYCPICRFAAHSDEWNIPEQKRYLEQVALAHLQAQLGHALSKDAQSFNRQQPKHSFLKMSMSYEPGFRPIVIPSGASEIMRQNFACEECACRYASIGAAFFCPACGHDSFATAFELTVQAVRKQVASRETLRKALLATMGPDEAEDTIRHILENGLVKLVSAFQRFAEATFSSLPNASQFNMRKNVFQNVPESSQLWRESTGQGYEDLLSQQEMAELIRFFQHRHLLAHQDGIVDEEYVRKSGDRTFSIGQRIVVRSQAVLRLADLVSALAARLRTLALSSNRGDS